MNDENERSEILKLRVAELEQAIRRLAEQDATLSVCEGAVTVTMDATLTDAERQAVEAAVGRANRIGTEYAIIDAATLRGLLDRTK